MRASARIESALNHGVDVRGRRIWLHGGVDEGTIGQAIRGMYLLSDLGPEPIELYVSSYGGELDEAFALHDVTRTIKAPVHTIALGKAMSAAPLLIACGQPGYRYATENCQFMLHDCSLEVAEGSPAYISSHVAAAKAQMATMAKLLGKYTKKPTRHWSSMFSGKIDRFFTADEAVTWGLVDQIWSEKD